MDAARPARSRGTRPAVRALHEVVPGVLVATAALYTTTTTVVAGDDGTCLVVDPAVTPHEIAGLVAALAARGLTVAGGVSTHPHWDHVLWGAGLGDVPRWATTRATTAAAGSRAALVTAAEAEAPGHDPALVGRLEAADGALPWSGAGAVELVEHGAHAVGAAVVLVHRARALLVGDMLSDVEVPLLDTDDPDAVPTYRDALRLIDDLVTRYDVSVVVPGHGRPCGPSAARERIAADLAYLDALEGAHAVADARLADPWVREEHDRQTAALAGR